ncbi:RNA ligase 1 isoform X2 [Embiotoca jacksoni]|uniref:RNA ligase 1 isoform X2 n=1 Tax=Embiotoca jacksoni TaxID=100190 RepID=UPI003703CB8A
MRRLGSVQQKMACVFVTDVKEEASRKRESQFQVVATDNVNPVAREADVDGALATEKLDGTCCYVTVHQGQPVLWARLDRKPNKQAEKRFRKYQQAHRSCKGFSWNVEEDFKTVPETWIPAHRVQHHRGLPVPDEHGHIPGSLFCFIWIRSNAKNTLEMYFHHMMSFSVRNRGRSGLNRFCPGDRAGWVPVEADNKQYCWHSSVVDYEVGSALVLRPGSSDDDDDDDVLEVAVVPLADLQEQTLELIGTNVNGNPYGLGSKKQPVHCLVSHGSVRIRTPPPVDLQQLCSWFQESPAGRVEGIVWHCNDGTLVKAALFAVSAGSPAPPGAALAGRGHLPRGQTGGDPGGRDGRRLQQQEGPVRILPGSERTALRPAEGRRL